MKAVTMRSRGLPVGTVLAAERRALERIALRAMTRLLTLEVLS
jgi:hypothetical protein